MISYIHSATVYVRDQDAALEFYVDRLGFEKRTDVPFSEESRWIEVAPPGRDTALALLRPEEMGSSSEDLLGAFTGISLVTEDIQATYERLMERGVEFTGPPQQMPWGSMATWINDPDGNRFFLTENQG